MLSVQLKNREDVGKMDQNEHIEAQKEASSKWARLEKQITHCCEAYLKEGDLDSFSALSKAVNEYCRGVVWTILQKSEDVDDAMQIGQIAVLEALENKTIGSDGLAYFARCVYKNKALDMARKNARERKKMWSIDQQPEDGDGDRQSIDIPGGGDPGTTMEDDLKRRLCDALVKKYCLALTASTAYPPRSLALYYGRLLPHILQVDYNEKTIPDSKATSATWAYERMEGRTIGALGEDSERGLQAMVEASLHWCSAFYEQLEKPVVTPDKTMPLKEAVYTDLYGKEKIEDWADYMHKAVLKDAARTVLAEPEMVRLMREYIQERDMRRNIFSAFIGGADR